MAEPDHLAENLILETGIKPGYQLKEKPPLSVSWVYELRLTENTAIAVLYLSGR